MSEKAVSVSALVRYLKGKIDSDARLQGLLIEGEISNFKPYNSGHWYFSLKDSYAQIRCVMFASYNRRTAFRPKDGDKVIVRANATVYEGRGELQIMVVSMTPAGIGDLYLQFEQLKKKLAAEGLFDEAHKKPLVRYPFRIALVTGKNTAARADVLNTLGRRWPVARIDEYPVLVQGTESAGQIIAALQLIDTRGYDVILLVRGGGSIEDLWSFNDEQLARTIYALKTPIVTGVGHEVDFTIVDFVSDRRAPTPTGAAEVCAPNLADVLQDLEIKKQRMNQAVQVRMAKEEEHLRVLKSSAVFTDPTRLYAQQELQLQAVSEQFMRQLHGKTAGLKAEMQVLAARMETAVQASTADRKLEVEQIRQRMDSAVNLRDQMEQKNLAGAAKLLDAYSPLKVLDRGYAIVQNESGVMKTTKGIQPGDDVHIRLAEGGFQAKVSAVDKEG